MNGILALGHFCETHGPCVMICTQIIKEKVPKQPIHSLIVPSCNACKSIEANCAFVSSEESASFVTTRTPLKQDIAFLIKQACVRSLSCEEEGGPVYFGDSERGHILSYTFRLHDSFARGFHRLYTIILLMRDKIHLLNSWPVLSENFKQLVDDLKKQGIDEKIEASERARRLATGTVTNNNRSLAELTQNDAIYAQLHLWFTWILNATCKSVREFINFPLQNKVCFGNEDSDDGFTLIHMISEERRARETNLNLRDIYQLLDNTQFRTLLYGTLVGKQIVIRSSKKDETIDMLIVLANLIPGGARKILADSPRYLSVSECDFLSLNLNVAVPTPNGSIVRLDILNDGCCHLRWAGILPNRLPTMLNKLTRAVEDQRLQNDVLKLQIQVIVEEWTNIAQTIAWAREINPSDEKLEDLYQSLGVQNSDLLLVKKWTNSF